MNTAADSQILRAYEQGLSPEAISEDLGFPLHAVKARLMQLSTPYRQAARGESPDEDELNFSREEQMAIKRELFQLAMSTEDEHLKGKLLLNLRDDGKGRKDIVKKMGDTNFNILQMINGSLAGARENARVLKDAMSV